MRIAGNYSRNRFRALVRGLYDPLFIAYCAAWPVIHYCRRMGVYIPFANAYLTDLVFIPLIVHVSLLFTRHIIADNANYVYPLHYLLLIALYVSVVFEVVLPRYSRSAIGDKGDILAYFIGSLFYFYVHQPRITKIK